MLNLHAIISAMEPSKEEEDLSSESEQEEQKTLANSSSETHRRKVQNATFDDFLSKEAASMTIRDIKSIAAENSQSQFTTASLLSDQGFASPITDPREYQVELFEKAKQRNTIAVLDTGSGKTLIAILLLRHVLREEVIDRAAGKPWRTSFFLVDSTALVHQQAAVLKNNIDHTVTYLFGAMGVDLWDKEVWSKCVKDNMVIVCTAEILKQCLLSSFLKMEQINLLIFDEAHHTKKDHPYARIIKDSYLKAPPGNRPRIFGMTASPIDAKGDVMKAASTLELLLDSKIATASDMRLLRQVVSHPRERLWKYPRLRAPFKTNLYRDLEHQVGNVESLESTFTFSFYASQELGEWCADTVWTYALVEKELTKLEGDLIKLFRRSLNSDGILPESDSLKEKLKIASEYVARYPIIRLDESNSLSPKVQLLRDELTALFTYNTESKCIVFTKRRHTARLLCELFTQLKVADVRPGLLIGVRAGDQGGNYTSLRQQFLTMSKFRKGELNCLFATSVAEEGLDIPDCNLVVRFDLYDTLIQYIQSRGRARHQNSTYAHMVEIDNPEHEDKLNEVHKAESLMRRFCEALPEDRLLCGNDQDVHCVVENDQRKRIYKVAKTGATLTYHSALLVLSRYASSLQYEHDISPQVNYFVLPKRSAYICEVVLPEKSPIRGLTGSPATQKAIAKQSAAFDTCLLLRKHGLLDDHFISTFRKRLPAMRNAKLAIISKKTNQYEMIIKSSFWAKGLNTVPEALFAKLICFKPKERLGRDHLSLLLLTRDPLPAFPTFPVYLEDDIETEVRSVSFDTALVLNQRILHQLTTFTFRVFSDVFNKTYEPYPGSLSYWLAPGNKLFWEVEEGEDPLDLIDWGVLDLVQAKEEVPRSQVHECGERADCFVFDKWCGKFRYFVSHADSSLRPRDPPPPYVQRRRHMSDIMNYCLSLGKTSRIGFLERCDWEQPVYHAELLSLRRNLLDRMTEEERAPERRVSVCLEPLTISSIPVSVVTSCLAFPAVISRFESYLIVNEACEALGLSLPLPLALEALTKDSYNSEEHRGEQIQFQRGMGKNYERLEFLGDAFLKMAVTIALFAQNPDDQEFDYHVNRMCLICNRNLFKTAKEHGIYKYIRSRGLSRRNWYPQGLKLLQGKGGDNKSLSDETHALGEKTIADVCEALIGASVLSGGVEHRFDMAVRAVTALIGSNSHSLSTWKQYFTLYTLPSYQLQVADAADRKLAQTIETKLGYRFKYPRLLRSAFTHPSYPSAWGKIPCYQRLEFLGDALYDMVCIEDLFHRYPTCDPQWLTEHKMAMVSNKYLGALSVLLGLHTHLQHFSNPLQGQISTYAEEVRLAEGESQDARDFWLSVEDPPKCLSDMVEAYIGAIFVDSGFQFEVVEDFYCRFIRPYFEDMSIYDTFANKHPTTFLHTRLSNDFGCQDYFLKAGELPNIEGAPSIVVAAVLVHGTVLAKSTGSSGRYAKIRASEAALDAIRDIEIAEFRQKYQCNCMASGRSNNTTAKVEIIGSAV